MPLTVKSGTCYALYVYDAGLSINLERCRAALSSLRDSEFAEARRPPAYFDYTPLPIRITQQRGVPQLPGCQPLLSVEIVLYDFGAVAVIYTIPFSGDLGRVSDLSSALYSDTVLHDDSRKRVETIAHELRGSVLKPGVSDLVEDYVIFQFRDLETDCGLGEVHSRHGQELARILRAERQALSDQEVADAVSCRISYGTDDLTLIDWNAALIIDPDAEDMRAVLEFANVELLELRFLDRQLDDALDRAYDEMSVARWRPLGRRRSGSTLRRISRMQVDGALLFERVSNALKLMGDQFLARLYRLAAQRFHLAEWNAGILRKLDTIDNLYEKVNDLNATRRLELLEWIIILLIALEIVLPFIRRLLGSY